MIEAGRLARLTGDPEGLRHAPQVDPVFVYSLENARVSPSIGRLASNQLSHQGNAWSGNPVIIPAGAIAAGSLLITLPATFPDVRTQVGAAAGVGNVCAFRPGIYEVDMQINWQVAGATIGLVFRAVHPGDMEATLCESCQPPLGCDTCPVLACQSSQLQATNMSFTLRGRWTFPTPWKGLLHTMQTGGGAWAASDRVAVILNVRQVVDFGFF